MKVLLLTLVSLLALSPAPFAVQNNIALSTPPEISRQMSGDAQGSEQDAVQSIEPGEVRLSGKNSVTASKPRFVTTGSITPRTGKSSGAKLGSASKGYTVWGTGKSSSGHTQIKFFGKSAWVKSNQLKRVAAANYTTTRGTKLRSQAAAGKTLATLPSDYTVGTLTNAKANKNKWVQVQYQGRTGWVASKDLKGASLRAAAGAGNEVVFGRCMGQEGPAKHRQVLPVDSRTRQQGQGRVLRGIHPASHHAQPGRQQRPGRGEHQGRRPARMRAHPSVQGLPVGLRKADGLRRQHQSAS